MKNIIIILLLFFIPFAGQSQPKNRGLKIVTTFTAWSILNGIGDGLNDNGHKGYGHAVNALSVATLVVGLIASEPDLREIIPYFVSVTGIRYASFDASYNLTRHLPYDYIGTTAPGDVFLAKVPGNFRTFTKGITLITTIGFTFNTLNHKKSFRKNKIFDKFQ